MRCFCCLFTTRYINQTTAPSSKYVNSVAFVVWKIPALIGLIIGLKKGISSTRKQRYLQLTQLKRLLVEHVWLIVIAHATHNYFIKFSGINAIQKSHDDQ